MTSDMFGTERMVGEYGLWPIKLGGSWSWGGAPGYGDLRPSANSYNPDTTIWQSRRLLFTVGRFAKTITTLAFILGVFYPTFASESYPNARCKYNVRDVAFVNVHGKSWQLQLVKPNKVDDNQFEQWNETLRAKLDRSNVGYVWLQADSKQAAQLLDHIGQQESASPAMALTGPAGLVIPFGESANEQTRLADELVKMLESPARREILDNLVDALCVVVLVESDDEDKNAACRQTLVTAIDKMERQMWTLEKPTDKGPVLVTISNQQKIAESWLLKSLAIENDDLPAVAIVFGQGRRLGEVLTGDEITVEKIVGRASVCGQDCECDLNRDWLYGQQMIHLWSKQHELAAERSLSFDPNSAFVIAEVAQIIQKSSTGLVQNQRVDLGGGLVVHDLDHIGEGQNANSEQTPAKPSVNSKTADSPSDVGIQNRDQSVAIPWTLLIVLLALVIMSGVFLKRKLG